MRFGAPEKNRKVANKVAENFEPNSVKPLAQDIYHYHLDHLGTITNANGQIAWSVSYRAYSNLAIADVKQVENHLRFQGQSFDDETGLHYNRVRCYDPESGQFTQQDPIGLLGGINNYQYAPNPIDPLGLVCKERYERYKALRAEGYSAKEATALSKAKRVDDSDIKLLTPQDFGVKSTADDQELLSMWVESQKALYLADTKTEKAYDAVRGQFKRKVDVALAEGKAFEKPINPIHELDNHLVASILPDNYFKD